MSVSDTTIRSIVNETNISESDVPNIEDELSSRINNEDTTNTEAVEQTFLNLVNDNPSVNMTDLWNYGIYRSYLSVYDNSRSAHQSWRAVSGSAFEHFVVSYYNERLPRYLKLSHVTDTEVADVISSATNKKASNVVDAVLLGKYDDKWHAVAGLNTLTSLKGRLKNYADRSDALRKSGLSSFVITLDAHIPRDSVSSKGEISRDSQDAELVGNHAMFDGLFSFNEETTDDTNGVAPIRTVGSSRYNDSFVDHAVESWEEFIEPLNSSKTLQI